MDDKDLPTEDEFMDGFQRSQENLATHSIRYGSYDWRCMVCGATDNQLDEEPCSGISRGPIRRGPR